MARRVEESGEKPPTDPSDIDALTEERRREREERRKEAERAARHNDKVGRALLKRRGADSRKRHSLTRAKAVARVVLEAKPNLAGRGLRYVLPQLREVEERKLKSGEVRHKVVLSEPERCREYLASRIEEAKSPQEVLEVLADALIAAEYADEREFARSHRVEFWNATVRDAVASELAADVKEVKIRRPSGA